ncbi:MAG: hypothetical protein KF773_09380 [Deltaproteobacteria bacterium]|nr:hypothetical protein [Deltaproteobacteria bacterium]
MRTHLVPCIGLVIAIAQAGCDSTRRNPEYCGGDGVCIDPALPFCDVDGSRGPAHTEDTCIAISCTPGEFVACRGAETLSCNSTGDNLNVETCEKGCTVGSASCTPCTPGEMRCRDSVVEACADDGVFVIADTCELGCVDTATTEPHCAYLEPVYMPNACDSKASQDAITFQSSTFDTDLDMNCNGGVVPQNAGPTLCVVRAKTISIPQSVSVSIVGSRALAFIGDASIDVSGTLNVSGRDLIDGPGGAPNAAGEGGDRVTNTQASGGGGFATAGAPGGTTALDGGANNGGPATTNPALLTSLIGGARGGGVLGGGAGGALTMIACRGTVAVSGFIIAGGGGGSAPSAVLLNGTPTGGPGAGGGSGGNVVLQGMKVEIVGSLFANGGGGSSGNDSIASTGSGGLDGGVFPGDGGIGLRSNGAGGSGGSASTSPSPGRKPAASAPRTPGGGGGSVGFLQTYTPAGVTPKLTPAAQSPMLQPNRVVKTR